MRPDEVSTKLTVAGLEKAVDDVRLGIDNVVLTDLMRQHNQRMYRIARGILRNDAEAEDIVQDAFVKAFTDLDTLRDAASIGAWLARVTVNMSISRVRQLKLRAQPMPSGDLLEDRPDLESKAAMESDQISPEQLAAIGDVRRLLEQEIDKLSDGFREVFVLREVEQMSVVETADALGIRPETVKTRLHRAKVQLRAGLQDHVTAVSLKAFPFGGEHCDRTTKAVLFCLQKHHPTPSNTTPNSHH